MVSTLRGQHKFPEFPLSRNKKNKQTNNQNLQNNLKQRHNVVRTNCAACHKVGYQILKIAERSIKTLPPLVFLNLLKLFLGLIPKRGVTIGPYGMTDGSQLEFRNKTIMELD